MHSRERLAWSLATALLLCGLFVGCEGNSKPTYVEKMQKEQQELADRRRNDRQSFARELDKKRAMYETRIIEYELYSGGRFTTEVRQPTDPLYYPDDPRDEFDRDSWALAYMRTAEHERRWRDVAADLRKRFSDKMKQLDESRRKEEEEKEKEVLRDLGLPADSGN